MINKTCGAGLSCCQWWRPSFLTCDDLRDTDHHPGPSSGGAGPLEALMGFLSVVQNTLATEAREGTTMAAVSWVADSEQSYGSKALILRSQRSQLSGLRGSTEALTALSPVGVTESPLCSQRSQSRRCHMAIAAFAAPLAGFHGADTAFLTLSTVGVTGPLLHSQRSQLPGFCRGIAAFTALSVPWASRGRLCVRNAHGSLNCTWGKQHLWFSIQHATGSGST